MDRAAKHNIITSFHTTIYFASSGVCQSLIISISISIIMLILGTSRGLNVISYHLLPAWVPHNIAFFAGKLQSKFNSGTTPPLTLLHGGKNMENVCTL